MVRNHAPETIAATAEETKAAANPGNGCRRHLHA
jgi:hypothetical protein